MPCAVAMVRDWVAPIAGPATGIAVLLAKVASDRVDTEAVGLVNVRVMFTTAHGAEMALGNVAVAVVKPLSPAIHNAAYRSGR